MRKELRVKDLIAMDNLQQIKRAKHTGLSCLDMNPTAIIFNDLLSDYSYVVYLDLMEKGYSLQAIYNYDIRIMDIKLYVFDKLQERATDLTLKTCVEYYLKFVNFKAIKDELIIELQNFAIKELDAS